MKTLMRMLDFLYLIRCRQCTHCGAIGKTTEIPWINECFAPKIQFPYPNASIHPHRLCERCHRYVFYGSMGSPQWLIEKLESTYPKSERLPEYAEVGQ